MCWNLSKTIVHDHKDSLWENSGGNSNKFNKERMRWRRKLTFPTPVASLAPILLRRAGGIAGGALCKIVLKLALGPDPTPTPEPSSSPPDDLLRLWGDPFRFNFCDALQRKNKQNIRYMKKLVKLWCQRYWVEQSIVPFCNRCKYQCPLSRNEISFKGAWPLFFYVQT